MPDYICGSSPFIVHVAHKFGLCLLYSEGYNSKYKRDWHNNWSFSWLLNRFLGLMIIEQCTHRIQSHRFDIIDCNSHRKRQVQSEQNLETSIGNIHHAVHGIDICGSWLWMKKRLHEVRFRFTWDVDGMVDPCASHKKNVNPKFHYVLKGLRSVLSMQTHLLPAERLDQVITFSKLLSSNPWGMIWLYAEVGQ